MEDETLHKERTDLSSMPIHMADMGSDSFELENTLGLMDSERRILREIEDALDRIERGTYGICEGGGEFISKARLEAIPWARYCVPCASLSEKGLLAKQEPFRKSTLHPLGAAEDGSDYDRYIGEQNDNFDNITEEHNNT
jgi:RNA polymerase-binding transcription factor DksA